MKNISFLKIITASFKLPVLDFGSQNSTPGCEFLFKSQNIFEDFFFFIYSKRLLLFFFNHSLLLNPSLLFPPLFKLFPFQASILNMKGNKL